MKRIYVAGPYSADNPRRTQLNVNKAISVGCELLKKGYAPFIPHLCHYIWLHPEGNFEYETWTRYGLEWLDVCDALFFIGESPGANNELKMAREKGLTIYVKLEEVPECECG